MIIASPRITLRVNCNHHKNVIMSCRSLASLVSNYASAASINYENYCIRRWRISERRLGSAPLPSGASIGETRPGQAGQAYKERAEEGARKEEGRKGERYWQVREEEDKAVCCRQGCLKSKEQRRAKGRAGAGGRGAPANKG